MHFTCKIANANDNKKARGILSSGILSVAFCPVAFCPVAFCPVPKKAVLSQGHRAMPQLFFSV